MWNVCLLFMLTTTKICENYAPDQHIPTGKLFCGFIHLMPTFDRPYIFQFDLDYCQALYPESLALEIAQALPMF